MNFRSTSAIVAYMLLTLSAHSYAGVYPGGDPPVDCPQDGTGNMQSPVLYVYRQFSSNRPPDECPGQNNSTQSNIGSVELVYESTKVAEATEPVSAYISCINVTPDSVSCIGSPVSDAVSLSFNWSVNGPLVLSGTSGSTSTDSVGVACVPGQSGTGTLTLTVSSPHALGAIPMLRSFECTSSSNTGELPSPDPGFGEPNLPDSL